MDSLEQNINFDVLDKLTKVCICKGITRAAIKTAIKNGTLSVKEVQKVTGAGGGACKGKRCTEKIQKLLNEIKS